MQVKKLFMNVSSNLVSMTIGAFVGLVLTPMLFRYLDATNYGVLAFAITANAVLQAIDLGMANSLVRYVSIHTAQGRILELRQLVSTVFYVLLGIGVLGSGLLALLSPLIANFFHLYTTDSVHAALVVAIVGLCVSLELPSTALSSHLMGSHHFVRRNIADIATHLARLGLIGFLLISSKGLLAVAIAYPLISLFRFAALLFASATSSQPVLPHPSLINFRSMREIRGFASLSFTKDLAARYYFLTDSLLAARFLPVADLAVLTVCRRIPTALTNIAQQPLWVAYPLVSSAFSRGDQKALQRFMSVATRTQLAFVLPTSAAMLIWAGPILHFWIGPSLVQAAPVFQAVIIFGAFASLESSPLTLLYGIGRIGFSTVLVMVQLAALVLLGWWVVPRWHLQGLAVLFAALYGVGMVLLFARAIHLCRIRVWQWLRQGVVPVLLPFAISTAWFWAGHRFFALSLPGLLVTVISGFMLYLACLLSMTPGLGKTSLRQRIKFVFMGTEEV